MIEILSIIGSLASIASLAVQVGVPVRPDGTIDVRAAIARLRLTKQQEDALKREGAEEIVGILIIDEELLNDIEGRIQRCIEKYRAAIDGERKRGELDVADKSAERCVCDALNRIKRRNAGNLPPGDFERWWISYRCVDDYDY